MKDSLPKVVLVDDEVEILENLKELLCDDFDVKTFHSPQLFLQALSASDPLKPDVVISDLKMPGMTGVEMMAKAQKLGAHFPFILLSGHLDKDAAKTAVSLGAFRLLEKPCPYEELMSTIQLSLKVNEVARIRSEIRSLVLQMKEMYMGLRLILQNYVPEDVIDRMILENPSDPTQKRKNVNFDSLMGDLESRLDHLLQAEKNLENPKDSKGQAS